MKTRMRLNSDGGDPTAKQRRELGGLLWQAGAVRGLQVFMVALGAALAVFDGRGWPPFIIGAVFAAWLKTQLPRLPPWAQRIKDKRDAE